MEQSKPAVNTCGACENFVRHYIKRTNAKGERYSAIDFGHCTKPRVKDRSVRDKACERWQGK